MALVNSLLNLLQVSKQNSTFRIKFYLYLIFFSLLFVTFLNKYEPRLPETTPMVCPKLGLFFMPQWFTTNIKMLNIITGFWWLRTFISMMWWCCKDSKTYMFFSVLRMKKIISISSKCVCRNLICFYSHSTIPEPLFWVYSNKTRTWRCYLALDNISEPFN